MCVTLLEVACASATPLCVSPLGGTADTPTDHKSGAPTERSGIILSSDPLADRASWGIDDSDSRVEGFKPCAVATSLHSRSRSSRAMLIVLDAIWADVTACRVASSNSGWDEMTPDGLQARQMADESNCLSNISFADRRANANAYPTSVISLTAY